MIRKMVSVNLELRKGKYNHKKECHLINIKGNRRHQSKLVILLEVAKILLLDDKFMSYKLYDLFSY